MSYHLNKDEEKGYTEEWIPYKPMVFEKEDMSLRQTQLQHRVGECQKTLDLLHALNHGAAIENLIHSTMDLLNFKVCKRPHLNIFNALYVSIIQRHNIISGSDGSQ